MSLRQWVGLAACLELLVASPAGAQDLFGSPRVFDLAAGHIALAADVDGDGDLDLLRNTWRSNPLSPQSELRVSTNDGNGGFVDGPPVLLPASIGSLAFGDVTGDGIGDVVTATDPFPAAGTPVVLVLPGVGNGMFAPALTFMILNGEQVRRLALGDVSGDGILDVAYVSSAVAPGNRIGWLIATGTASLFTYVPSTALTPIPGPLLIYDVDLDGLLDILACSNGILVHRTQPAFTVQALPLAPIPPGAPGSIAFSGISRMDWDQDGFDELVAWGRQFSELRLLFVDAIGGTAVPLVGQVFLGLPASLSGGVHPVDWDADGDLDILARSGNGNGTTAVTTFLQNSGPAGLVLIGSSDPLATQVGSTYGGAGVYDINADGFMDFVGEREILFGDGTFTSRFLVRPAGTPRDLEGDGDTDIDRPLGPVHVNDGTATFVERPRSVPAPLPPQFDQAVQEADFDGDGLEEYLVRRMFQFLSPPTFVEMRLFEEDLPGTALTDLGVAAPPGIELGQGIAVDMDGDGDLDLLADGGVWTYTNGSFTASTATYANWRPRAAADLDGDGDIDAVATSIDVFTSPAVALLRNEGSAFTIIPIGSGPPVYTIASGKAVLTDLDLDGDADLALGDAPARGILSIAENIGGGFPSGLISIINVAPLHEIHHVFARDLDFDGRPDLVFGASSESFGVALNTGPGLAFGPPRFHQLVGLRDVTDVDGDGDWDAIGFFKLVLGRTFHPPSGGGWRQVGAGSAGTGGVVPVLGATGPLRPGFAGAQLRIRDAIGGAPGLLTVGAAVSPLMNVPVPGVTLYNWPILAWLPLDLAGPAGAAGAGTFDLPHPGPLPPALAGQVAVFQAGFADAGAPGGLAVTNGLEVTFGL